MKKILLTGVKWDKEGMIGSALLKYLQGRGYTVIPFEGDIRDPLEWVKYSHQGYSTLIHLAAKPGVRESLNIPEYYWDVNVNGTANAFQWAEINNVDILWASSSNAKEWWVNPYAASKKACEALGLASHVPNIGMRFHTVWPGRDDMLYKMIEHGEVEYINVDHKRDFTHVDDICTAIETLMINRHAIFELYDNCVVDIGSGIGYSVREVWEKYAEDPSSVEYRNDPTPHERTETLADISLLTSLGWKPTKSII